LAGACGAHHGVEHVARGDEHALRGAHHAHRRGPLRRRKRQRHGAVGRHAQDFAVVLRGHHCKAAGGDPNARQLVHHRHGANAGGKGAARAAARKRGHRRRGGHKAHLAARVLGDEQPPVEGRGGVLVEREAVGPIEARRGANGVQGAQRGGGRGRARKGGHRRAVCCSVGHVDAAHRVVKVGKEEQRRVERADDEVVAREKTRVCAHAIGKARNARARQRRHGKGPRIHVQSPYLLAVILAKVGHAQGGCVVNTRRSVNHVCAQRAVSGASHARARHGCYRGGGQIEAPNFIVKVPRNQRKGGVHKRKCKRLVEPCVASNAVRGARRGGAR
jgi:hypothetical protein